MNNEQRILKFEVEVEVEVEVRIMKLQFLQSPETVGTVKTY